MIRPSPLDADDPAGIDPRFVVPGDWRIDEAMIVQRDGRIDPGIYGRRGAPELLPSPRPDLRIVPAPVPRGF